MCPAPKTLIPGLGQGPSCLLLQRPQAGLRGGSPPSDGRRWRPIPSAHRWGSGDPEGHGSFPVVEVSEEGRAERPFPHGASFPPPASSPGLVSQLWVSRALLGTGFPHCRRCSLTLGPEPAKASNGPVRTGHSPSWGWPFRVSRTGAEGPPHHQGSPHLEENSTPEITRKARQQEVGAVWVSCCQRLVAT